MSNCFRNTKEVLRILHTPRAFALGSCLIVSACGGSGSSTDPQLAELDARSASAKALIESFQPITYTDPNSVPTSGMANYAGYFLGQMANTDDIITNSLTGDMDFQLDFAASGMVSGTVSGILDDGGNPMSGQIVLSGGRLDRSGDPDIDATFGFEGNGSLTDISSNTIDLDLVFEGDFLGPVADGIAGDILGRAQFGGISQSVGGAFIAEVTDLE